MTSQPQPTAVAPENEEATEAWSGVLATFTRLDLRLKMGSDMGEAVALNMALGPAAELIRLNGEKGDALRPQLERELREVLADFDGPGGVYGRASTWIVTARVPS